MVFEENRAFSADAFGIVKPLSDLYVAVTLDYWQIFWGNNSTNPGRFLRKYGFTGIDTAGQVILSSEGELLASGRSWKIGKGFTPEELRELAARFPADPARKDMLRLSWFMVDPDYYRIDTAQDSSSYGSAMGAATSARKMRRPLVRVDGPAIQAVEENQEFLRRHVRQFWWHKGEESAPARLVVLNPHDTPPGLQANALTGQCAPGKVPAIMATIDLASGVDLEKISALLDGSWRDYMKNRPSNADNLTFAKENISTFKAVDARIRALAREGKLVAPGGRELSSR